MLIEGTIQATELHGTYQISFGTPADVSLDFNVATNKIISSGKAIIDGHITEMTQQISGAVGTV